MWQLMATAPCDGRKLLLGNVNAARIDIGTWNKWHDRWWDPEMGIFLNPTHWMPLSELPSAPQ